MGYGVRRCLRADFRFFDHEASGPGRETRGGRSRSWYPKREKLGWEVAEEAGPRNRWGQKTMSYGGKRGDTPAFALAYFAATPAYMLETIGAAVSGDVCSCGASLAVTPEGRARQLAGVPLFCPACYNVRQFVFGGELCPESWMLENSDDSALKGECMAARASGKRDAMRSIVNRSRKGGSGSAGREGG